MAVQPRRWRFWLGLAAVAIALVVVGVSFVDEPMRALLERQANDRLKGYEISIGKLDAHPFSLSLDFENVILRQTSHPDPPIIEAREWSASVHWRQLLKGHLVSDHLIEQPKLHINLEQLREEAKDEIQLKERGWQDAVLAMYPLEINEFTIHHGEVIYSDHPQSKPLRLANVEFRAGNIRNIESQEDVYPSEIHLECNVSRPGFC